MKKLNGESMDITAENIKAMEQLFPEAFEDGKIDFGVLRQLLGDFVDDAQEKYSFKWNGKGKALRLSQTPSMGTLRPCREESKDWDNTENLYIEGDNLEVLKLLQKSYYGKVKMIYIDPPYNTGNDFVYKDNFRDNIQNYREITGQVDGEGNKNSTNTEASGRFHTDWLNMMYPRLRLARNLLSEDGVIFISIDDNERDNTKTMCDEIFGADNFINVFIWQRNSSVKTDRKKFTTNTEYIILYAKTKNYILNDAYKPLSEASQKLYNKDDNDGRGRYQTVSLQKPRDPGPETTYDYVDNNGKIWKCPPKGWRMVHSKLKSLENDNRLCLKGNTLRVKDYWNERDNEGKRIDTLWNDIAQNTAGSGELEKLMKASNIFDNPKPTELVTRCLKISHSDATILDFFSGSATTAHAVMQLNAEDGGKRKFIMVQLPEATDEKSDTYKAGYKNICEIGKERIRRAGDKIKAEAGDKAKDLDIGFKVFKLDSSNLQKWNPQPENIVENIQLFADNFLPDRSEQDVLYEIILKMGLDLSCPIEEVETAGETIYIIGDGALMICLGEDITTAVADQMVKLHQEYDSELWQVVFRDTGFASDMDKTNIKEILKSAGLAEDSFVCV